MSQLAPDKNFQPAQIGDDFIMRPGMREDIDQLAEFNRRIHSFNPDPDVTIPAMTRDLLSGVLSTVQPEDFILIIEPRTGRIASSMVMIPQTWSYGGVPFNVGRPELVGTDPGFRGRGLIREQFRRFHAICKERDQLVQAITGIPFFYRQFGYELGLPCGGGRICFAPQQVPALKPGANSEFMIHPARIEDLDWIQNCYQNGCSRYLVTCIRNSENWLYELYKKSSANIHKVEINAITSFEGQPVGFFISPKVFGSVEEKIATWFDLLPGYSWHAVTPAVLRRLWADGQVEISKNGYTCTRIGLVLGIDHPAYKTEISKSTKFLESEAWYVRVADVPEFLKRISSVLDTRLSVSPWSGFSGELKISTYTAGLRLVFRNGLVDHVGSYQLISWEDADVAFPNLCFNQLLFGFRSLEDLMYAYPDCWANPEKIGLVESLFPKMPSNLWGLA